MKTGEVHENLSFIEVSDLTEIPRNKVGKYVQAQHVKSGTYIVTYHGVTIEETANGDMSKYEDKTETKVYSYSPEFRRWFTPKWNEITKPLQANKKIRNIRLVPK